jgi:hypothetical protein
MVRYRLGRAWLHGSTCGILLQAELQSLTDTCRAYCLHGLLARAALDVVFARRNAQSAEELTAGRLSTLW